MNINQKLNKASIYLNNAIGLIKEIYQDIHDDSEAEELNEWRLQDLELRIVEFQQHINSIKESL